MSDKLLHTVYGLSLDAVQWQKRPGQLSYALNCNLQSKDGSGITYTNEYSNQLCVEFPDGYTVIGTHVIPEKNEIIFALVNTATEQSEIGRVKSYNCNILTPENVEYNCSICTKDKKLDSKVVTLEPCCEYTTIINQPCLQFDIDFPVRMIHKLTNCGFRLYFTDNNNNLRYLDLDDTVQKDSCGNELEFSCERIKIFKDFCSPAITPDIISGGGNLTAGTYQALFAYTDIYGQEYTDYFEATNPVPIFDRVLTNNNDYLTSKSIKFKISHNTDIFEYFKLVIIKTVNETSEYIEAGIYKVSTSNQVVYTGNDATAPRTSLEKIRIGRPTYNKANFITESSDHLILADLEGDPEYNFQPFVNQQILRWETVKMPYDSNNNYANGIVSSKFRGYMRDEVYPFAIRFKLKNGKKTKAFHIPNREAFSGELQVITNDDAISHDDCGPDEQRPRWKVYNTGTNLGGTPTPGPNDEFPDDRVCDISRWENGEFAYWESTETYPCDESIWGDLAGKPIRYHKFPDSVITHIHDSFDYPDQLDRPSSVPLPTIKDSQYDLNRKSTIYPIGVRLDETTFNSVLANTMIYDPTTGSNTIPMSDLICGFEIVRGNRVGNKSVEAKGILYDVGKITEKDHGVNKRTYYFPNYPYNDLGSDPYLSKDLSIYDGPDPSAAEEFLNRVEAYPLNYVSSGDDDFRRFTFHSPDTHFQSPQIGTELKLETEEFGLQEGHFVQVEDHPRYKFLTKFDAILASSIGVMSGASIKNESETKATLTDGGFSDKTSLEFNYADMLATTSAVHELIKNLIPKRNFAYAYHSRGVYNNFVPVPNDQGKKIRRIEIGKYLSPNNQNVRDDNSVHNFNRESSVYFRVNKKYGPYGRGESSRFTLGTNSLDTNWCDHPEQSKTSKIRSWYASMKREVPDQYGNIDNVKYVSTGYTVTLEDGLYKPTYYPAFGGDVFINRFALKRKMPFFVQNMVGRPDEIDFDYNLVPNIAFPQYYIGTSPDELKLDEIVGPGERALLLTGLGLLIAANAIPAVIPGVQTAAKIANVIGMGATAVGLVSMYKNILSGFVPKNNLDCDDTPSDFDPNNITDFTGLTDKTIFYQSGKFYLANYGIPNFFVESDINLEYRYARNEKEENFYPNVGNGIPDNWLQEKNVPIFHDNKYNYNATYSLQNYQDYIQPFNDYNFDKLCQSDFPNRIIYSEKSSNEENFDNWLKFGANNYYDFDKSLGKIVSIDSLDNNKILVRFENAVQLFNTRITLQSNSPYEIAVSNSGLFTQEPIEFSKTNTGHGGSQNIAFEKTPHGYFWADAKRGEVFQYSEQLKEISRTNYNWFKENLPFKILKDFPDVNIDNAFKQIGISLCWDERYERLFLTKLDYELLPQWKGIVRLVNDSFVYQDLDVVKLVDLKDPEFFANKSFTISWSPLIDNWVSFYSFLPNYYISLPTHFQTGIHNSLWNHNLSNLSYQTYYGKTYPYILELPVSNIPKAEMINSITVNTDILKYSTETDWYSLKSVNKENYNIFFNKAIVYNKEQCSGLLDLVEVPMNDLSAKFRYPIYNNSSISILYSKHNKVCTFNNFYDITRNYGNSQPVFTDEWSSIQSEYPIDKVLNLDNTAYNKANRKVPIVSNQCYVRLIQDVHNRYKFINHFEIINQK